MQTESVFDEAMRDNDKPAPQCGDRRAALTEFHELDRVERDGGRVS
jgi:hypothetical protein